MTKKEGDKVLVFGSHNLSIKATNNDWVARPLGFRFPISGFPLFVIGCQCRGGLKLVFRMQERVRGIWDSAFLLDRS